MLRRFGSGTTALPNLVRERQDLRTKWQVADKQLTAALSRSPDRRGVADERARKQIADIDARIAEIDQRLKPTSRAFSRSPGWGPSRWATPRRLRIWLSRRAGQKRCA